MLIKCSEKNKIDVAFIDELHTHEQSLRDAVNCLKYLNNDGCILFHDCNPQSEEAADKSLPSKPINWNGDVWKTIYHFRKLFKTLRMYNYKF